MKGIKGFQKADKNINRKGPKTKAEILGIAAKLDSVLPIAEVLQKLANGIKDNNMKAIEVWMHYYYGKPKETVKLDGNLKISTLKLIKASESNG